ncbi:MAG: histidinol-phosphate transaminase [Zoogloeaceae bacterium]|jgi:histidinol-phosphate aminotransferase|nr:histidinol-phosphate transaminase [Zoogloeaceae bacterium]
MSQFWNPLVSELLPYVPGEQPGVAQWIKLNTNENPYPPSPRAIAAMREALAGEGEALRRYPDPDGSALRAAIARHYGEYRIRAEQIFLGNGSDEVLAHVFLALLKQARPLFFPDVTYSFYPSYCRLYGIRYATVPLDEDFVLHGESFAQGEAPGAIILPNPNAPTGRALALAEIASLVRAHPDIPVVIDEAYVDFGAESAVALVHDFPNLLVVQTFSKSRALAGLRVGFAIGHPALIEGVERVKNSFNSYPLDRVALAGAVAAMEDEDWFAKNRQAVIENREALAAGLAELGFAVLPSQTNFLFVHHPLHDAARLAQMLRAQHILVRHFNAPRISGHLRISIGTKEECAALLAALRHFFHATHFHATPNDKGEPT